jgi:hypothetical protein
LTDSVAVDAKRILLRYGAPIAILDKVSEAHRIEFAREIAKTMLPERERRLRHLLAERGYTDGVLEIKKRGKRSTRPASPPAAKPRPVAKAGGKAEKTKGAEVKATKKKAADRKAKATTGSRPKPKAGKARPGAAKPMPGKKKSSKKKSSKKKR